MGFAALSDIRVITAFWIGAVSTLLAVVLLLEVLRMRLFLMVRERRSRRFRESAQQWLIRIIAGEAFELPRISQRDLSDFLYQWVHFQEILRGDSKLLLNQALVAAGLDAKIRKLLRNGSFEEQLIAATALGHLGDVQSWGRLLVLLKKTSPLLSMTAARALVLIDSDKAQDVVIPLIVRNRDWMPVRLASMLKQGGQAFQQAFLVHVAREAQQSPPYLLRLMRLLEAIPRNRPLPLIGKFLADSGHSDLLAVCLRLVCHPSELELVRKQFGDNHWSVQVQIASLLGRMGAPQDAHYLLSLLDSEHWWVRYRAAQALAELPFITRRVMKRLMASRSDVFARDMLLQIVEEKGRR